MSNARNDFGRNPITRKTKKLNPRVDLAAMVSVSFLLIIFFMLTSYLAKPQAMELGMPNHNIGCGGEPVCGEKRNLTLLLGKNNEIVMYEGSFEMPLDGPSKLRFDKNSLRKTLLLKNKEVIQQTGDPKRGLIVLIKPSQDSNYGNLVTLLDELAISNIYTYAVVDITPEEIQLLSGN